MGTRGKRIGAGASEDYCSVLEPRVACRYGVVGRQEKCRGYTPSELTRHCVWWDRTPLGEYRCMNEDAQQWALERWGEEDKGDGR